MTVSEAIRTLILLGQPDSDLVMPDGLSITSITYDDDAAAVVVSDEESEL